MPSDTYKRIWFDVMFLREVIRVIFECLSLCLVCLPFMLKIIILRVFIKNPNPTTPLEKCSEGDTCVMASPVRIQQYFGDHDSCKV